MALSHSKIETLRRDITSLLQVFKLDNVLGSSGLRLKLNMTDLTVIVFVGENEKSPMSALANVLGSRMSTVTSIVDRLIEKKLVLRKKSEKDRRLIYVHLSAEGLRLYNLLVREQYKNTVEMLSSLAPDEQEFIAKIVGKVADTARKKIGAAKR